MPTTINLGSLTPPTVANTSVAPRIWTKSEYRDGTRPSVDPPAQTIDWNAVLRTYGSGTVDPSVNIANLHNGTTFQYLGSFRIPHWSVQGVTGNAGSGGIHSICYRPPNGNNGANGSLFVTAQNCSVAELQIPELRSDTDHLLLNPTTILQDFVNIRPMLPSGNTIGNNRVGWIRFEGGKIYMGLYHDYSPASNHENLAVCTTPDNLASGTYWGGIDAWTNDWGARYCIDLTSAWQSTFGHTHLAGVAAEPSLVSRASVGHSLVGITLSEATSQTTTISNTTWSRYNNPINGFSATNGDIVGYYAPLAWATLNGQWSLADFYDPNIQSHAEHLYNWGGIDSQSLSAFSGLPIQATGRITTLDIFPVPDPSLRRHALSYESPCGVGFILPGTSTICFLGGMDGARYGQYYKGYFIEDGPGGYLDGGFGTVSKYDKDPYIWLINLNDVANRVSIEDPQYYYYGPWGNSATLSGIERKHIISGHFDSSTNKLYLLTNNYYWNQFDKQTVVSVYQIEAQA